MIGMGRTGTTILHDLLGQDPANRVPRTWEVDRPCPPPEAATHETDPRIAEVQAPARGPDQVHPEFQAMHPTGARLAQECIRITGGEFASLIFFSQYRLPSYLDVAHPRGRPRPPPTGGTGGSSSCCSGTTPASGGS